MFDGLDTFDSKQEPKKIIWMTGSFRSQDEILNEAMAAFSSKIQEQRTSFEGIIDKWKPQFSKLFEENEYVLRNLSSTSDLANKITAHVRKIDKDQVGKYAWSYPAEGHLRRPKYAS